MATLTVQTINSTGLDLSFTAAEVGGDEFANTGKEQLFIQNDDASAVTVTIATPGTCDGMDIADKTLTVAAGALGVIGGLNTSLFNDSNGNAQVTYSSVTSLTVAVGAFKAISG